DEFVSLLFSKPRARGLDAGSTAREIFDAYEAIETSERLYTETLARVRDRLYTQHRFALADEDVRGIEFVFRAFYMFGTEIKYSPFGISGGTVQPTYAALMAATDDAGEPRAYLATEDRFAFVKNLQARNLIVPVVGNFAGPTAIAGVARYLKQRSALVSAFYL